MARQPLKHRAQTIPPNTEELDKKIRNIIDATLRGIQDSNKNIFDDLTSLSNQSPQSGNPLYFGDPEINGTWRIIVSGSNLSVQLLEAGIWNEKHAFTP